MDDFENCRSTVRGAPCPRTAFRGGWDHRPLLPSQAARRREGGAPTGRGPPSHTCGNTRGGATSNWSPRTQCATPSKLHPRSPRAACPAQPLGETSVLAYPGPDGDPDSPSVSKGRMVPKRGPASRGARGGRQSRAFPSYPKTLTVLALGASSTVEPRHARAAPSSTTPTSLFSFGQSPSHQGLI